MTWTKLDDRFWCHRKVADVGLAAVGLYVRALVWANQNGSDGDIPMSVVKMIGAGQARPGALAKRLVSAGLWHESPGGGYRIHDFAEYQPTREQTTVARSQLSEARAAAGRMGAQRRAERRVAVEEERIRNRELGAADKRALRDQPNATTCAHESAPSLVNEERSLRAVRSEKHHETPRDLRLYTPANAQQNLSPDPDPVCKNPPPPQGARKRGEANNTASPDELPPVSAEPHPSLPPVSEGGEDGAPEREQPPPCESGTFAVAPKRPENAPKEAREAPARVEVVPPLPAPLARQQSPCGKTVRPREVRLLEAPFFATAYAEGIVQAKAEKGEDARYVVPHRAQMTLDDAIDGHAPVQRSQDRVKWLRKAAYLFGIHAVGPREQGKLSSYDPGAFLTWVNSGALSRVVEAEMAKRRRAERARLPEPTPEPSEEERLRGLIARNRMVLERQANGGVRLMKPADLEAQIAEWEAKLAELSPQRQANPEAKPGLLSCKPEANASLLEYISEPKPQAHSEPLAAGAEGGPRG